MGRSLTRKSWSKVVLVVSLPLWWPMVANAVEITFFNWNPFSGVTGWTWSGEAPPPTAQPVNNVGCNGSW